MNILIRELEAGEILPLDILLLADPSIEIIKEYTKRGKCFLAILEDAIIGAYVLINTRPLTMELVNVSVKEDYQGKGVGKKLVLHAISKAKSLGMKVIEVGTGNSSLNQLALYQKCGFRLKSIDSDFFKIHYKNDIFENGIPCIDMIRLSKNL